MVGAREKYLAAGFTDYLTKPIDGGSLEDMLMRYLPPEKVVRVWPDEASETRDSAFEALRTAGIRPEPAPDAPDRIEFLPFIYTFPAPVFL